MGYPSDKDGDNASGEVFLSAFAQKNHRLTSSGLGTEFGASPATACHVKKRRGTKAPVHTKNLGQRVRWRFGIFPLLNELCSLQVPWWPEASQASGGFLGGCPRQVMQNQIKKIWCVHSPSHLTSMGMSHCPEFGGCSVPHPSPQAVAFQLSQFIAGRKVNWCEDTPLGEQ